MDVISVIVPVYNVEPYLKTCIDSIVGQTYKNIELILVDDGSSDNSGQICDEYAYQDSRIKVFHRANSGVSAARNFGISKAQGDWILFVDSDDWINTRLIETCQRQFAKDDTIDICFFGIVEKKDESQNKIDDIDEEKVVTISHNEFRGLQYRIFNRDRNACVDRKLIKVSSPCKFYRKSMLLNNKITFSTDLVNGEDGLFNLYAYRHARKGIAIEQELYYYRNRVESVTRRFTPNVENDFNKLHKLYQEFIFTEKNPEIYAEVFQERLIWSFSFCCILKYCHQDNMAPYAERKKEFENEYSQNYHEKILSLKLKNFLAKKRIMFYFIKKQNFFVVYGLCKLEAWLNNRLR